MWYGLVDVDDDCYCSTGEKACDMPHVDVLFATVGLLIRPILLKN